MRRASDVVNCEIVECNGIVEYATYGTMKIIFTVKQGSFDKA